MLDLDDDEAREVRTSPIFVKLVRILLLDAIVAGEFETLVVVRFEIRIGWRLAKTIEVCGEVSVKDDERLEGFGMLFESFGQQHVRTEMHRPTPELRQSFALNADVLNVLRVFRRLDRRNDLGNGLQNFFSRKGAKTQSYNSTGRPSRRMIFNAFVVGHGPGRSR